MKIKTNDNVMVITGKDKGKSGKVLRAIPKKDQLIVEGINLAKKHQKSRSQGKGGEVIDKAMPIHVSNVKKVDGVKKSAPKKKADAKVEKTKK